MPCESIVTKHFADNDAETKICLMRTVTSIDTVNVALSDVNDEVNALVFNTNKKIKFLPVNVSHNFPLLKSYSATACSLRGIRKDNFRDLEKLEILILTNNKIETVRSNVLEDLQNLKILLISKVSAC